MEDIYKDRQGNQIWFYRKSLEFDRIRHTLSLEAQSIYDALITQVTYFNKNIKKKPDPRKVEATREFIMDRTGVKKGRFSKAIIELAEAGLLEDVIAREYNSKIYIVNFVPQKPNAALIAKLKKASESRSTAKKASIANGEKGKFSKKGEISCTENETTENEQLYENEDTSCTQIGTHSCTQIGTHNKKDKELVNAELAFSVGIDNLVEEESSIHDMPLDERLTNLKAKLEEAEADGDASRIKFFTDKINLLSVKPKPSVVNIEW